MIVINKKLSWFRKTFLRNASISGRNWIYNIIPWSVSAKATITLGRRCVCEATLKPQGSSK